MLMYNNSASSVLFVYNLNHNVTSLMDLSNTFLFLNDYGIPFLWTSLRNSHYPLSLTLSWSLLTSSPSRQFLSLSTTSSYQFVLHIFSNHGVPSHVTSDRGSEFVSNFFCLLGTALNMQLHFTLGYHSEGDGQTECINQTFEQYLHIYYNY